MLICKFCNKECKNDNSLRNHERLCSSNPMPDLVHLEQASRARLKAIEKTQICCFCGDNYSRANIKRHEFSCVKNPVNEKECPVCTKKFVGKNTTCSYSCSNTFFRHGRKGGTQFREDSDLVQEGKYRDLCFRYHKKQCVVCGEKHVVAVHHLNENHDDNRPENLIPLCPTHHQYMHSRHKDKIEKIVLKYIGDWVIG